MKGATFLVISMVMAVMFASEARAQYLTFDAPGDCSGAAGQLQYERPNVPDGIIESYLYFVPDAGGCITTEGEPMPLIAALNFEAYDPNTGEELGMVKDLDPDLTSGANALTYEEFCGAFIPQILTAQDYYDEQSNDKERAILDPDGDGLACTDEDDAFLPGDVPSSESDPCANAIGGLVYVPAVHGCLTVETIYGLPGIINGPVYDADEAAAAINDDTGTVVAPWDTGEELGIFKDLVDIDYMNEQIGLDVTFETFCEAFPTSDIEGYEVDSVSLAGLTAQEYYDELANSQESTILDPNSDGLACTPDDDAFLSGDFEYEPILDLEDTWTGTVTQTDPDGEVIEFDLEADMIPLSNITGEVVGEVIGEVGYPGIGCSGVWILTGFDGASFIIEERIVDGRDKCFESPITLTPGSETSLEYYFLDDSTGIEGECTLTLLGSPKGVATDGLKPSEIMARFGITYLPDTGGPDLPSSGIGESFAAFFAPIFISSRRHPKNPFRSAKNSPFGGDVDFPSTR